MWWQADQEIWPRDKSINVLLILEFYQMNAAVSKMIIQLNINCILAFLFSSLSGNLIYYWNLKWCNRHKVGTCRIIKLACEYRTSLQQEDRKTYSVVHISIFWYTAGVISFCLSLDKATFYWVTTASPHLKKHCPVSLSSW